MYKGRMEAVQWISASDIEKIFINIPEIVQFSTALLSELDAIRRRDVEEQVFGETFLNFVREMTNAHEGAVRGPAVRGLGVLTRCARHLRESSIYILYFARVSTSAT